MKLRGKGDWGRGEEGKKGREEKGEKEEGTGKIEGGGGSPTAGVRGEKGEVGTAKINGREEGEKGGGKSKDKAGKKEKRERTKKGGGRVSTGKDRIGGEGKMRIKTVKSIL